VKVTIKRGYPRQAGIMIAHVMFAESSPCPFGGKTFPGIASVGLSCTLEVGPWRKRHCCRRKRDALIFKGK
jgi:hypothetical protein